ncbi:MAG TPA: UdgX family uracil-DNA binding protein [Candidatus Tectomicrobia bacterium]|nr:UdgX family uracil-DNA binding protein [Candidatus Tectomicrobia bacterium]
MARGVDVDARLESVRERARACRNCPLWESATQTVFGEGPVPAPLLLVGEQPGDREDLEGHPFVGPAGRLLDRALVEAGLEREQAYVTNVVKHFKWRPGGGGAKRIHDKPDRGEIDACLPWFRLELELVQPRVLVCLGATAAQALLGREFRVSRARGVPVESELAPVVIATVHPSSVLRAGERRDVELEGLVHDLRAVARALPR